MTFTVSKGCALCQIDEWNYSTNWESLTVISRDEKLIKIYRKFRELVLTGKLSEAEKLAMAHHIHPDFVRVNKELKGCHAITLLGSMTRNGNLEAIRLLIALKSDVCFGYSSTPLRGVPAMRVAPELFCTPPLFLAIGSFPKSPEGQAKRAATIALLLQNGADPLQKSPYGFWLNRRCFEDLNRELFYQLMPFASDVSTECTVGNKRVMFLEAVLDSEEEGLFTFPDVFRPGLARIGEVVQILVSYGARVPDDIVSSRLDLVATTLPKKYLRHREEILKAHTVYHEKRTLFFHQQLSQVFTNVVGVNPNIGLLIASYMTCEDRESRNRIASMCLKVLFMNELGEVQVE